MNIFSQFTVEYAMIKIIKCNRNGSVYIKYIYNDKNIRDILQVILKCEASISLETR